ncbi:chymotrypsin-2-like [Panulirus ornatus]|uniref:chymotrypsin-2-like n=1 Tax=Panulirus ornatus TaxID=150431 RepID=UPI003A85BD0B
MGSSSSLYGRVVVVLLAMAAAATTAAGAWLDAEGGQALDERIVGGEYTADGDFPEVVSVMTRPLIGEGQHLCGGLILNENHVLTTATCVLGRGARDLKVVAAGSDLSGSGDEEVRNVQKIFIYDFFDSVTKENDLAVLRTSRNFVFVQGLVGPGLLPETGTAEPSSGTIVTVAGWGRDKYEGEQSPMQRAVNLTYVTHSECQTVYGATLQSNHGCMVGEPNHGVCDGDEGGPVLMDGLAIGIVAWQVGCDAYPASLTLLEYYYVWIQAMLDA